MGNGPSKDAASPDQQQHQHHHDSSRKPRRRESTGVLPSRAAAAPPSTNLDAAQGQHAAQLAAQPARKTHSRGRSQTTVDYPVRPPVPAPSSSSSAPQGFAASSSPQPIGAARSPAHQTPPGPHPADPSINDGPDDDPHTSASYYHTSQYGRPPRLPLPIQEEVLSPGSPIISAADFGSDPVVADESEILPRNPSMLSSNTVDEEDQGELGDEFRDPLHKDAPLVDTLIVWRHGGDSVYVTGSFSRWNKKWRMHRSQHDPSVYERVLPLPVGTHHLTFIVDGEMRRASDLPTAVDYTNYLVNYIEVHLDEGQEPPSVTTSAQATPQPTPGDERPAVDVLPPPTPDIRPQNDTAPPSTFPSVVNASGSSMQHYQVAKRAEDRAYHPNIPRFLADLDEPEESSRFQRASMVLGTQPAPPSLPMFLNKSILNGATPMKDDASVLIMPNHTVLNHLATSSIKNNVLATSATTRYKRKYVTTIMYKPTNDQGE